MTDRSVDPNHDSILAQVLACCKALDDKKAEDIKVLHLGPKSSITDYFIIATGTSNPHLKALGGAVEGTLKELQVETMSSARGAETGWFVVDAYDFMVHLFTRETRAFYDLETLWKDAEVVAVAV